MKFIYPAIFHHEDNAYWVEFPDLEGCQSFGDTLEDTFKFAKEALSAYCETFLEQGKELPQASETESLKIPKNAFTSLVEATVISKGKAVKKTLTIPSWLNEQAKAQNINFSQTLQDALIEQLNL